MKRTVWDPLHVALIWVLLGPCSNYNNHFLPYQCSPPFSTTFSCKKLTLCLFSITTGLLLPAYHTFKVLKANKTESFEPMLTKWIVIAIFASICYLADVFVSWLPFYQDLKILCLAALILLKKEVRLINFISFRLSPLHIIA